MVASGPQTLKSSEKLFAIIDGLRELGEAGVTELADHVSFHKSTVYVHLQTMRENGLVEKVGETYRLSLQFVTIAEGIKNQRAVYRHGSPEIDRLAADLGEVACLGVPEDGTVVVVHEAQGEKATQSIGVGSRVPMAETAVGRAMLAFVDDDATSDESSARPFGGELGGNGDDELEAELEAIRRDGYVVAGEKLGEEVPYVAEPDAGKPRSQSHRAKIRNRIVAAPIRYGGRPVGVVAVVGPEKRVSGDYLEEVIRQVRNTAELVEQKLTVAADA